MKNNKEKGILRTRMPVKKIGDSYYLLVDRHIRENLYIETGIILGAKLWNIATETIICPVCKHEFEDEVGSDPHDCPKCGKEFLNIEKGVLPNGNDN